MTRLALLSALAFALVVVPGGGTAHEKGGDEMTASIFTPKDMRWKDAPASLPAGAKVAVLEGDPAKEGPFVIRMKMPDGYRVPPHTHPRQERVTVIAGTLNIGMGGTFDAEKCKEMPAGSFGTWPPGMKHFGWMKGETVLQLHGTGPWVVDYVNPKDDPRNRKD